ncbi:hypothetical protein ACHAPU_009473 [Fusarium lateritium]
MLRTINPKLQDTAKWNSAKELMNLYLGEDALLDPEKHVYQQKYDNCTIPYGQTCVQAFWRTLARDCASPPRTRRLKLDEIRVPDGINQDALRDKDVTGVFTIRVVGNNDISSSVLASQFVEDCDSAGKDVNMSETPEGRELVQTTYDCMLAATDDGMYVLARPYVQEAGFVAVLDGSKVPMILRKVERSSQSKRTRGHYTLICSAYVHEFMDGSIDNEATEERFRKKDTLLVMGPTEDSAFHE